MCDEWLGSDGFSQFLKDMGEAPEGLSLDRKDNDLGYSKDNCRWADPVTQSNNISTNHLVSYKGRTQTISLWARELGVQRQSIYYRLRAGWTIEDVMERPSKKVVWSSQVAICSALNAL
jgi:hypothetical protein